MCLELDSLEKTMRQLEVGQLDTFQAMVMEQLRIPSFEIDQLAKWASKVLGGIGKKKEEERRALEGLDPDYLEFYGLDHKSFSKWNMDQDDRVIMGSNRKRGAICILDPQSLKVQILEDNRVLNSTSGPITENVEGDILEGEPEAINSISNQLIEEETETQPIVTLQPKAESQVNETTETESKLRPEGRSWSWKKEARRQAQRGQFQHEQRREREREAASSSSRQKLDFQ